MFGCQQHLNIETNLIMPELRTTAQNQLEHQGSPMEEGITKGHLHDAQRISRCKLPLSLLQVLIRLI